MSARAPAALVALLLAAVLAAPAEARTRTYVLRSRGIAMGGFNVRFPRLAVRVPHADGYVVRMHARLVDGRGRRVTIRDVMLHHVVFRRRWHPRRRLACTSPGGEAFYGTGEEDQTLRLPPGYGYRVRPRDRWRMTAMLMSHSTRSLRVHVQYRVTVVTGRRLTGVHAFWVRANGCGPSISYPVPARSRADARTFRWRVPYDARIVAAGGHLHGGSQDMWLSQPRCGGRRLLDARPFFGMPDSLYYRARPVLHEPGPVDTHYFLSRQGVPVLRGEHLRLTGLYDATRPHPRVMAIMHVYVARDRHSRHGCRPLPADRRELQRVRRVRLEPPVVKVPLTGLDDDGHTFTILDPPWPIRWLPRGHVVDVADGGFSRPHLALPAGARITWRFPSRTPHAVVYANGPQLTGTPILSRGRTWTSHLRLPGHYELFCYLHPVTMHEVIEVTPSASSAAVVRPRRARRPRPAPRPARAPQW